MFDALARSDNFTPASKAPVFTDSSVFEIYLDESHFFRGYW